MWIKISDAEYFHLFSEQEPLSVHASVSDPTGYYHDGRPYMSTDWGAKGGEQPTLRWVNDNDQVTYYKAVEESE